MSKDRRLAAIMFTDIVGYTALMGKDEDRAFKVLRKNREIQRSLVDKHQGEWLKEMGDGILSSFHSATDAIHCAREIQKQAKAEELVLRIGIHQGEVVFEDKDVFGDGVNIASRLQELAAPNTIYISGTVQKEVKNKKQTKTEFVAERPLKNVDEPVRIFKVIIDNPDEGSDKLREKNISMPDKKSIIVLPFENMSSDPEQEYFSDGLTDEIITDLSYIDDLQVISRSSAMTFKGSKKKITEIAQEVNVRYVLEGSVRKVDNKLRIIAQLIDASSDTHLWAEKYNGTLDDIFDFQEKVSVSIADVLKIKLGQSIQHKISDKSIVDPVVYDIYLKARYEDWQFNEASLNKGEKLLQEGLKLGGENALLYAELSHTYVQYVNNLLKDPEKYPELLNISDQYAKKALKLNPKLAVAHYALGLALYQSCHPKEALESFERGIKVEPTTSESSLYLILGFMYAATGLDMNKSYELLEKGKNIDPVTPISKTSQGWRLLFTGEFQKMVDEFEEMKRVMEQIKSPTSIWFAWWHGMNSDFKESFRIIDWVASHHPGHIMASLGQFMKHAWSEEKDKALASVNKTLEMAVWWDDAYCLMLAEGYAILGEYDEAFRYLNRAIDYGITNNEFLTKYDHFLENLRLDKRFEMCLAKAKNIQEDIRSVISK